MAYGRNRGGVLGVFAPGFNNKHEQALESGGKIGGNADASSDGGIDGAKASAIGAINALLTSATWDSISQKAFGASGAEVSTAVKSLNISGWPTVRVVDGATLNGAKAAYAEGNDTILVSRETVAAGAAALQAALLEELGHAIDARLAHGDAEGDEGAIFSALVRGLTLSASDYAALKSEDDHGTIVIDGVTTPVEFAGTYGAITVDGSLADWTAADRIDTAGGTAGYEVYGKYVGGAFVFALKAPVAIGANTTAWLNTDRNAATGYQIWGFAGGAEYNVNFNASGVPALYTGADGQTQVGTIDYTYSADRRIVEFAVLGSQVGNVTSLNALFDVNNSVFLSNNYAGIQYTVAAPVAPTAPTVVGSVTLDGALTEWTAAQRIDTSGGTAGYEIYAKIEGDNYVFALKSAVAIGANTTAWLNTDRNAATGYQIWGFAGGAEYNINWDATGAPGLYTGAAGQTRVGNIQYGYSADKTVIEFVVAKSAIGNPASINTLFDVNDSVFLSNSYANIQYTVAPATTTAPVIGAVTLDGSLAEWTAAHRIDGVATVAGHEIYGRVEGDSFIIALKSATAIGVNTTAWLNTDQNTATGYNVFGAATGSDFNVNFGADGKVGLFTGTAGQTAVTGGGDLKFGRSADGTVVEIAIPKALIGTPGVLNAIFDINDQTFLPGNYGTAQYAIVDTAQLPVVTESSKRVAIVYSETTAANYFSKTAYSQLFMAAQNQAVNAGVPYDVLSESDLTNLATLAKYDTIVFPSFRNVAQDKVDAITSTLQLAVTQYKVGLIAAGDFMTNNATNGVLAGDPYARMKSFFDLTREGGGTGAVEVKALATTDAMDGYTAGETIRSYASIGYSYYQDATPGVTAPTVLATQTTAGVVQEAAYATVANGNRNVHFATDGFLADSNQLQQAIKWSVNGAGVTAGLQISRDPGVFAARNDMDQAMFTYDVSPTNDAGQPQPGIYDKLLPLLAQWKAQYNFVGSYYVDIGDRPDLQETTDWARSLPYYQQILALGNELGSHSLTHLGQITPVANDTNYLRATGTGRGTFDYEFRESKAILDQRVSAVVPGFVVTGAAVPGAPETVDTALNIIQYYNYLSGGYAGVGAGYPGAIGYLTPGSDKVYIAPNMKFDFTLAGFLGMSPTAALAEWRAELAEIASHSDVPVYVFPWHDYGATAWVTPGDTETSPYTTEMFTQLIATAAATGAEFVTLDDLARRMSAMEKATIDFQVVGNVVNASVISTDAGKFALDLDGLGSQKIASVANWYAYDDDSVFLPKNGGNFAITLGATATDVTRIIKLPARAELVTLSGNGTNLSFTVTGEGRVVVDLKNVPGASLTVTGATIVSRAGDILTLDIGAIGIHNVSITQGAAVNAAPVITSNGGGATAAISLAENLTAVTTVTATDADVGQTKLFSISGGADASKFTINAATGALAFITAPDFENRTDVGANNVYDVIVKVEDNLGASDTQAIAVTITNVVGPTRNGTAGNDTITGTNEEETINGLAGNDILNGLGGNDIINGGAGNDTIDGGAGDDTLNGEAGNDTILGGDGNDRINGGAGYDTMTGGAGADVFVFSSVADIGNGTTAGTRDTITDFQKGIDKIDLSAIDANTFILALGNQAFSFLPTAGQAFTGAAQVRFLYQTIGGVEHTIIEGNVDTNLAADFRLDLVGRIALTASDFVL